MIRLAPSPWALAPFATACLVACGEPGGSLGVAPDGQLQMARSELAAGRLVAAREAFAQTLEADPGSIDARLGLAETAQRLRDPAEAERVLEEVLGLGADRQTLVVALRGLAALRHEDGDDTAAVKLEAQAAALSAEAEAH